MIQAIVFDCFGVLTTDSWLPFKDNYFGHDPELLQQATDLNKQSDAGLLAYEDFIAEVGQLAGLTSSEVAVEIEDNVANGPLFAYIQTLKPRYKIGMLSNAAANWLDRMFTPEQLQLFDAVTLSCDTGFIKPQPQAFEAIADRLQLPLEECLLVDDQERYCIGARDIGMPAIWYQSTQQTTEDITKLLS